MDTSTPPKKTSKRAPNKTPGKSPSPSKAESARLGREDWLNAAYEAVVEGGFDQVRVLLIADKLGVTRGSFYWHFTDHADLVTSLCKQWCEREIADDRRLQAHASDDPVADLVHVLDEALSRGGVDLKNMRFELALRGLGRRDPAVAKLLVAVDEARMAVFIEKFQRLTGDEKTATELSVLFYLAVTGGVQALARPSSNASIAAFIRNLIADYLIRKQAPAA